MQGTLPNFLYLDVAEIDCMSISWIVCLSPLPLPPLRIEFRVFVLRYISSLFNFYLEIVSLVCPIGGIQTFDPAVSTSLHAGVTGLCHCTQLSSSLSVTLTGVITQYLVWSGSSRRLCFNSHFPGPLIAQLGDYQGDVTDVWELSQPVTTSIRVTAFLMPLQINLSHHSQEAKM